VFRAFSRKRPKEKKEANCLPVEAARLTRRARDEAN